MRQDTALQLIGHTGSVRTQIGEPAAMPSENTVCIAIELSVCPGSLRPGCRETTKKSRLHRLEGGDTAALLALIAELPSQPPRSRPAPWTWRAASKLVGTEFGCIDG